MKAVGVFPGRRSVEITEHPEPSSPAPNQIAVRMLDVGICGTDREIVSFTYGAPPKGSTYLVIGHESLGEVIETGSAVTGFQKGDLVVLQVRRPCAHSRCTPCRTGHPDFCRTGDFSERGIVRAHGYMTERVVEAETYAHHVPQALRNFGVLLEPLSIAEKALGGLWSMEHHFPWHTGISNVRALVLGAGPVGLLGAMLFAVEGAKVTVYSRERAPDPKTSIAQAFGCAYLSSEDVDPERLSRERGPFDVVFEATGAATLAFRIIETLSSNAMFVFTGVPGRRAPVELDAAAFMRRLVLENQVVFGSVNAGYSHFEKAIEHLEAARSRWPEATQELITARHPMSEAVRVLSSPPSGIKHVISVGAS